MKKPPQEKKIEINCEAKESFPIEKLVPFQGKLKSIDKDKFKDLKKSLIKKGLPLGFHVWKDKDKIYVIDGHHRLLALTALQDDGFFIPNVPCTIVHAKSKKEAAESVLISNSKYAEMSQESLSDFMIHFELNLESLEFLDLPDLDMSDFAIDMGESKQEEESVYTDKIKAPIYTPKGDKPKISELFNLEKAKD